MLEKNAKNKQTKKNPKHFTVELSVFVQHEPINMRQIILTCCMTKVNAVFLLQWYFYETYWL